MIAVMKKPEILQIETNKWVCVAHNATQLTLHKLSSVPHMPQYYWTYRPAGSEEVPTSFEESVCWATASLPLLDFTGPVDVYIWAQEFSGKIRVDIYD